jgi:hypothetical protein
MEIELAGKLGPNSVHMSRKDEVMATAQILFTRAIQDSQDYGCFDRNDDYMVSRVFFSIQVNDQEHPNVYVEVRQPYGTRYDEEPLEVSKPVGYDGAWNHAAFSELCENYYRSFIGRAGHAIRIEGGSNFRMRNNTFVREYRGSIDIPEEGSAAW